MLKEFSISGDVQVKSVSSLVENVANIAQRTLNSCNLLRIDERLANEHSKLESRLSTKESDVKVIQEHKNKHLFIDLFTKTCGNEPIHMNLHNLNRICLTYIFFKTLSEI